MSSAREKKAQEEHFRKPTSPISSGLFAPQDSSPQSEVMSPGEERNKQQPQPNSEIHNKEDTVPPKWIRYRVRAGELIEEDEPILMAGKYPFASRGNIQTVIGKPKSCKTFLTSAMAGACIAGQYLGMTAPNKNLKVLMFDTEQGRSRAQKVQRRVNQMCNFRYNEESNRLEVLSVREADPAERMKALEASMTDIKPDLVILDGVRDLLNDFNSVMESAELVNKLMRLSVNMNCAIVTVIHQNKGDFNARGHLGSELMNKSETVAEVRRADKISTVSPVYCRNEEFEEFSFRINEKVLPELCDIPDDGKRSDPIEALERLITKAMFGSSQMLRTELRKKLESITGQTDRTANRKITDAISIGLLELLPDNDKMVRLRIEFDDSPDGDDGLPF